jgi:hypothetical protein
MAAEIKQKIMNQTTGYFSITSDGWSQPTKSPNLYSLTIHSLIYLVARKCKQIPGFGKIGSNFSWNTGNIHFQRASVLKSRNFIRQHFKKSVLNFIL